MSHWIHVAGNIRFDSFSLKEDDQDEIDTIRRVLGEIPSGSEGPLKVEILSAPAMYCARYSVSIYGDLRDVPDFSGIDEWVEGIKRRCLEEDAWIRQGVIQAMDDNAYEKEFSKTWEIIMLYNKPK